MIAFASSLDQAGPLTRDVTDARCCYRHMTGAADPLRLDLASATRRRSGCRAPSASTASASAYLRSSSGEGIEAGRARRASARR